MSLSECYYLAFLRRTLVLFLFYSAHMGKEIMIETHKQLRILLVKSTFMNHCEH
jgi:hypothetical protein